MELNLNIGRTQIFIHSEICYRHRFHNLNKGGDQRRFYRQHVEMNISQHESNIQESIERFEVIVERFGFWPTNSLIAQWFQHEKEILVQRIDLPQDLSLAEDLDQWCDAFLEPINLHSPTSVDIWITPTDRNRETHSLLRLIESRVELARMGNFEFTRIDADSILLRSCTRSCSRSCAKHRWTPSPHLLRIADSRSVLSNEFAYQPELGISEKVTRSARENIQRKSAKWRATEVAFLHQTVGHKIALTESKIARIAQAFTVIGVRDAFLWDLAAQRVDSTATAEQLSAMLPHLTGDLVTPIATVAGTCWWLSGNGAKANMCADRAHEGSRGYALTSLLQAALRAGLPPRFWVEGVLELSRSECLDGGKVA